MLFFSLAFLNCKFGSNVKYYNNYCSMSSTSVTLTFELYLHFVVLLCQRCDAQTQILL